MISTTSQVHPFDARGVSRRFRHAAIFAALDALMPGETLRFVNDHDPLPLLDQLRGRYGEGLAMTYRQTQPGAVVIDFTRVPDKVANDAENAEESCGCCGSCG